MVPAMNDAELLERADLNLIEFNRESARCTTGGLVHEEDGLVFFIPGHRFPVGGTGVMRSDPGIPAQAVIKRTEAFFRARDQGWTYWIMAHRDADLVAALHESGVSAFGDSPGMVIEQRLDVVPLSQGVTIERVHGEVAAREFADVNGAAYATYGMPSKVANKQFADHRFFDQPHVAAILARIGGAPAAAAMVVVSHGVAGVYWVGTTPEARGHGLAAACTRAITNIGFDMGADFAALQASVMGEPIYLRLGYREITRYPWYVVMP